VGGLVSAHAFAESKKIRKVQKQPHVRERVAAYRFPFP
jgi:hypothetical protein